VAELVAEFGAIETALELFAAIDRHRPAREWLGRNAKDAAATVSEAVKRQYARITANEAGPGHTR
jgi:hypothetical protein